MANTYFKSLVIFIFFIFSKSFAASSMVSPTIDANPNQPFSYFSKPTDEIGMLDVPLATEITPEGYLYTGFAEILFFAGSEHTPISERIRTLEQNDLPIIHYTYRQDGIDYQFTLFAATLDGSTDGQLINFIQVAITNTNPLATRMDFSVGMRYQNSVNTEESVGDNRFKRPFAAKFLGDYQQLGEEFNPDWQYAFTDGAFLRNNKILYLFEDKPEKKLFTLKNNGYSIPDLMPRKLAVLPDTPVGITRFTQLLKPNETKILTFKMPVIPASLLDYNKIAEADFDDYKLDIIDYWRTILKNGMSIELPEEKVTATFNASLIYDLLARDKIENHFIQTVNKLQYHEFFLRDAADIAHMYDITGYPDYAADTLKFFALKQQEDGNFISQPEEYDAWGQVLWSYGQHYRFTKDRAFAESVYPQVKKAFTWLKNARKQDPLHLITASTITDNEKIAGHITGYNFLGLAGLRSAIYLAENLQQSDDAKEFSHEYQDYYTTFIKRLTDITTVTKGYIPPTLDGTDKGQDWGNLLGVYPEAILDPWDERITATLKSARAKYQEGIMTYGDGRWLHHYLTIKNTETALLRGEQEQVLREFYSVLLHTSSTHAGFEYGIRPWGNRNFEANLAPHGWFAAEYRTLLRNMLVREENNILHLLSTISPAWLNVGQRIVVSKAPTEFGVINFTLKQIDDSYATLTLKANWQSKPDAIVLHIPWFMEVEEAIVDGKEVKVHANTISLSPYSRKVELEWSKKEGVSYSYQKTVDDFKREYQRRYDQFMHG